VSLEAVNPSQWRRDPWAIVNALFAPCYIAGWSAAEHWGLTEQIFADLVVMTTSDIRRRSHTIKGIRYLVSTTTEAKMFGLETVWRDNARVRVSSPTRTVADMLDKPHLGGGIKHVGDVVIELLSGEYRNDDALIEFASKLRNRTLFKRLGFLIETTGLDAPKLLAVCRDNISAGYSRLDPNVRTRGRLLRRWNLEINVEIGDRGDNT
jgi:predicted transcriptional regulator of viral defense system